MSSSTMAAAWRDEEAALWEDAQVLAKDTRRRRGGVLGVLGKDAGVMAWITRSLGTPRGKYDAA